MRNYTVLWLILERLSLSFTLDFDEEDDDDDDDEEEESPLVRLGAGLSRAWGSSSSSNYSNFKD